MKRYQVKSGDQESAVMDVLEETSQGLKVRITRCLQGNTYVEDSVMSVDLFAMCERTGYIREIAVARPQVA